MKHEIQMPVFVRAHDYHDFSTVRDVLSAVLRKNVEYIELQPPLRHYYAMFYTCPEEHGYGMTAWENKDVELEPLIKL